MLQVQHICKEYRTGDLVQKARTFLTSFAGSIHVSIPFDQPEVLAGDLADGYQGYAEANGLPDPSKMDDHFTEYLNTESGKQILTEGISGIVDMQSVEQQVTASLQNYMGEVMGTYSSAVGQALQTQITSAMQQIAAQISGNLENVSGRQSVSYRGKRSGENGGLCSGNRQTGQGVGGY